MITGSLKWYTVASTLEQAVYAGLTAKPARHSVVPGTIADDDCGRGLLAVSVAGIFLSESFPDQQTRRVGCDAPYEVGEIVIRLMRCAPSPDGQLLAPSTVDLDASAQEVLRDAYEVLKAVSEKLCQMDKARDISSFMLRPLTAAGPSGSCVGNELRVFVALMRN